MSIEQPRFMLAMILRDIERFEKSECEFLFSPEFLARLNRLDASALYVLRFVNGRGWGPILLEAFIKEVSLRLRDLESEAVPEDHVMRNCHQRDILPFQLARQHAVVELWSLRTAIDLPEPVPAQQVPKRKRFFR